MKGVLPQPFVALEPYAEIWALPTENRRSQRRWSAAPDDFKAFYDAFMPRIEEILEHLDSFDLGSLPDPERRLYWLALAFAETAPHVELYGGSAEVPHSFDARRFRPSHGNEVD